MSASVENKELVIIPAWVLKELVDLARPMLNARADRIGMAGHTPSEQLQHEYAALDAAEALLKDAVINPPEIVF